MLEDRLKILDFLETLVTQAPDQPYYEFALADFDMGSTAPSSMRLHLDQLYQYKVLAFTVPAGLSDWNFWDAVIRIRNIDISKVHELQKSTKEEVAELIGDPPAESPQKVTGKEGARGGENHRYWWYVAQILGFTSVVLGIISPFFSLPGSDTVRALSLVGVGVIVAVGARLYPRMKDREVTGAAALDMLAVSIFVTFATTAAFIILKPNSPSAPPSLPLLRFAPGQASQSNQCHQYQGTGSIPPGYQLEIYVSSSRNGPYYYAQPAINTPISGGWETGRIKIENDPTWITAVLVTSDLGDYLGSIKAIMITPKADNTSEPWMYNSGALPPTQEKIPQIEVNTNLHGSGCAPT